MVLYRLKSGSGQDRGKYFANKQIKFLKINVLFAVKNLSVKPQQESIALIIVGHITQT